MQGKKEASSKKRESEKTEMIKGVAAAGCGVWHIQEGIEVC